MKRQIRVCRHMHRRFPIAIFWVALFGCAASVAEARSLEEIKGSKELRVCLVPVPGGFIVEPPNCRENCAFSGDNYDLSSAFAGALAADVKLKVIRVEWDEQFFNKAGKTVREDAYTPELLASGKCDVYATGLTKLPWREKKLAFVVIYPTRMMVVANKSRKEEFKSPSDLCGKTAATVKDTSYHTWLQAQNEGVCATNPIRMQLMTFEESGKAVDSGKTDFLLDNFEGTIWLGNPFKNSTAAFPVGSPYEQGWAFRKEDKDLQEAARKFFEDQKTAQKSILNKQWEDAVGMSLPQYIERVPQ